MSQAQDGPVNRDWLLGHLDRRSFGLILLTLGLLVIIPGGHGRHDRPFVPRRRDGARPQRSVVNVIPGIVIALVAVAYLQEDGALLLAAVVPAIAWISSFAWTVWASAGLIMRCVA